MLIAEARVETGRPGRYLAQLCQHLSNRGRHLGTGKGRQMRHRPGGHGSDHPQPGPAEQVHVEWSESEGTVSFPRGQCTMQATSDALVLRAEAADEETLQFIQDLITSHLDRFSRREHLTVAWQRAGHRPPRPNSVRLSPDRSR
jgi:hypothetical protein